MNAKHSVAVTQRMEPADLMFVKTSNILTMKSLFIYRERKGGKLEREREREQERCPTLETSSRRNDGIHY